MCAKCKYKKECKKVWGKEYYACEGSHHCRKSWDEFLKIMKKVKS